ncbi:MAG: CCA tRNA nucleotidyltransferase [Crenarchaeota archaeon]|nr:CCA tRNA nucleotidyltransferase [Thermoproteota archaeon]MCR8454787.1 CCA tRNA nucleotidyltransferase [Thermoproteota archaeon]MCR8501133.1 CCA tRNA nucleotidyltransferase [Thermoproteota archaeon]
MFHGEPSGAQKRFLELPSIRIAREEGREDLVNTLLEVLHRIIPSDEEDKRVRELAEKIKLKVEEALRKLEIQASVEIEGSVARGTWISGSVDFDIFILLPPPPTSEYEYKGMLEDLVMKVMRELDLRSQMRYAEHPYLHVWIEGYEVDIVPAFESHPEKIISAVDRTPYHTRYVRSMLNDDLRNEVRLLKGFLKGIGVYGAEIKVGGFSGYACELLIIYYGSFLQAVKELSRKKRILIDLTRTWSPEDAFKKFNHSFILVDPVDRNRNVTNALRRETICRFQLLSKLFLAKPSSKFFFPKAPDLPKDESIISEISRRKLCMLVLRRSNVPPDVYWGQALRIMHKIKNVLERSEFSPIFLGISEGKNSMIILIETRFHATPTPRIVSGPPTSASTENILSFIRKYRGRSIAGPWIEGQRIVFLVDESVLLSDFLEEYVKTIKIEPSFTSFEIIDSPSKMLEVAREEEMLQDMYSLVIRREILNYIDE